MYKFQEMKTAQKVTILKFSQFAIFTEKCLIRCTYYGFPNNNQIFNDHIQSNDVI